MTRKRVLVALQKAVLLHLVAICAVLLALVAL